MTKNLSMIALIVASLLACNDSETPSNDSVSPEQKLAAIDPKAKGGNSCLLGFADKYGELLTVDMVATATGMAEDKIATENQKVMKDTKYHDVNYSWKTGRMKTFGGMKVPVADYVKLTGIEAISLDRFQMSYKAVSKKEAEALKQSASDAVNGKSDNEAVTKQLKKLDDMGISKEEQKKMMEGFTNSAQKMTEGFAVMDNLGDAATWNSKTNTMYVFKNGVMFELVVDITEATKNQEVAGRLAKMILEKCK